MRRGTTPIHEFGIPFDKSSIKSVKVIYAQKGEIVFCKNTPDCGIEDGKITIRLSQEDTLKLDCGAFVYIQLKILTKDNEVLVSDVIKASVDECLDNEVIV